MSLLVATVAVAAAGAAVSFIRFRSSGRWVSSEGRILRSEVRSVYRMPGRPSSTSRQAFDYRVEIEYEYLAASRSFTGSQVWAGGVNVFSSEKAARDLVARYPAGSIRTVYVNRADPGSACLVPGPAISARAWSVMGLLLMIVVALILAGALIVKAPRESLPRQPGPERLFAPK